MVRHGEDNRNATRVVRQSGSGRGTPHEGGEAKQKGEEESHTRGGEAREERATHWREDRPHAKSETHHSGERQKEGGEKHHTRRVARSDEGRTTQGSEARAQGKPHKS